MTTKVARRRMPKRTGAETRQLMLRAAVDMLRERVQESGDEIVASALAHVRLTQVAQRATALVRAETGDVHTTAITTGAIYQLWPSQADFQADLLFHIADLQSQLVPGLLESIRRFAEAAAQGVPLEEVFARTMDEVLRHYRQDPLFRVEHSFLISAGDPRVRVAITHRQSAFAATADQAWTGLMDAYGLRMRAPYRVRDLTNAMAAQIGGASVISIADPQLLADPAGEQGWSLTARALLAIFQAFTEPA
ncbi:MAG TPA: hypothetical protein VI248_07005 [Kineosporiaceae bacterium]